eukprot:scaffold87706_cov72-Attheya_sp.AAC.5
MLGLEKPTDIITPNTEDLLCHHVSSPRCNPRACTDLDIPKAGQACQYPWAWIIRHGFAHILILLTYWEKHHQFYMRHDLFLVNEVGGELPTGKVNRTAALCKARNKFIQQCLTTFCPSSPTDAFTNEEIPRHISPCRILIRNTPMSSMNGREHRSGAVTSPAYQGTAV